MVELRQLKMQFACSPDKCPWHEPGKEPVSISLEPTGTWGENQTSNSSTPTLLATGGQRSEHLWEDDHMQYREYGGFLSSV